MGILGGDDDGDGDTVTVEKFSVALSMNVIRMVDKEAGVVLYTDTTREGYTSIPIDETDLEREDLE